jgi:hypothetical protein
MTNSESYVEELREHSDSDDHDDERDALALTETEAVGASW